MRLLQMKLSRRIGAGVSAIALLVSVGATGALAGGPPGVGFYVDGDLYRTVGTPTDFSTTGAPDGSYDVIYALGNGLMNVAEARPGDPDYNGGRWQVLAVTWDADATPTQYTFDWEVRQAEIDGLLTIGTEPVKQFECPVIPLQGGGRS